MVQAPEKAPVLISMAFVFFFLYLVVHVFCQPPEIECVAEPDKKSEKAGQSDQEKALPPELCRNPADAESDDGIDGAADAHVEQKF